MCVCARVCIPGIVCVCVYNSHVHLSLQVTQSLGHFYDLGVPGSKIVHLLFSASPKFKNTADGEQTM